jgi:aldehyde:ferredoxin oxidoreductase
LMGSKKLKALVARGTGTIAVYDSSGLQKNIAALYKVYPPRTRKEEVVRESQAILKSIVPIGGFPARNWSVETFGKELLELADDTSRAEPIYCKSCPYGCGESLYLNTGERHMVWEAWGPLGTNCLINNSESLQEAYSLCNRYGLDSISTGGVIGFAMECFEHGLINEKDAGADLRWGNHAAMVAMVKKIATREGFGAILAEGVRAAGEKIGGLAREYALHVKGLEFPAHDPRAAMGGALAYATGSIGATHMEAAGIKGIENYSGGTTDRSYPEFGYPSVLDRFAIEGKGELTAKTQNFGTMIDSLVVCLFLSWRFQPSDLNRLLNYAAGLNLDLNEFMLTGERIFNLIRMINVRRGISRNQDTLPGRFLTHKRGAGGAATSLPAIGLMLSDYYEYRGWSEEGIPTRETLRKLGLDRCLDYSVC